MKTEYLKLNFKYYKWMIENIQQVIKITSLLIIFLSILFTYYKKNTSLEFPQKKYFYKLNLYYLSPFLYGLPNDAGSLDDLTNSTNIINVTIYGNIDNKFSFMFTPKLGFPR